MKMHPSLTSERVNAAADRQQFGLDNPGFCLRCGNEQDGCEPDARRYVCEACGEKTVYGAEELALMAVTSLS